MNKILFNPFLRIAGFRALILGLSAMVLTAGIAFFSHCHFDGVLDAHIGKTAPAWIYFAEGFINLIISSALFFIAGLLFSKSKIRFIDLAGTMALARWPMLFIAIIAFAQSGTSVNHAAANPSLLILGFCLLIFSVWSIALMFNAYVVSCNVTGSKATLSFIGTLLVAELISKLVFQQFYQAIHLF